MVDGVVLSSVAERLCGPGGPPVLRFDFEGAPLTAIRLRGRAAFIASEVGGALGYAGPSEVGELVTDEWRAEFTAGRDFDVVRGRDLRDLKELVQLTGQHTVSREGPIGKRARACMLLYERGLDGVIMKTNQPAGVRMRAWLRDEVLPKLRRGEGVPAVASVPAPVPPTPAANPNVLTDAEILTVRRMRAGNWFMVAIDALLHISEVARDTGATDKTGKMTAEGRNVLALVGRRSEVDVVQAVEAVQDVAQQNLKMTSGLVEALLGVVRGARNGVLDDRVMEIAALKREVAEARLEVEQVKSAAFRAKVKADKAVEVLRARCEEIGRSAATAAREADEEMARLRLAFAEERRLRVKSDAQYQAIFLDYSLMGCPQLGEWWSPTRIAAVLGENVTAEDVGAAVSRIPALRKRGDIEGMCRAVPYTYRHGAALREGTRYEYSRAAMGMIIREIMGIAENG